MRKIAAGVWLACCCSPAFLRARQPSIACGTHVDAAKEEIFGAIDLPFAFPFFGQTDRAISINSDGTLTFTGGVPRIGPLFTDLDPATSSGGVFSASEPARFTASWIEVPVYSQLGTGSGENFRLYPDSAEFRAAVVESFSLDASVDVVAAAQAFYQTHDDVARSVR